MTRVARGAWVLLGATIACLAYGTFASGAQLPPGQTWFLLALAAIGTAACAAWLYGNGLALRTSRLALAGVAALVGFALWIAAGIGASVTPDRSWATANVVLGYAVVVVIGMLLGSSLPQAARRTGAALGVALVVVALYALGGVTVPAVHVGDLLDFDTTGSRLQEPLGYWNALALCCVSGLLPLLRVAADPAGRVRTRIAALVGVQALAIALSLTYSRGGLVALGVAVLAFLALTTERARTVALLALAAAASAPPVALVVNSRALGTGFSPLADRVHDGRIVAIATLACAGLLAAGARALIALETNPAFTPARGRALGQPVRRGLAVATVLAAVAFTATGGAGRAWDSFTDVDRPAGIANPDRVLSLNSGTRWTWWKEAAGAFSDKPLTGWGAGSFTVTHLLYRKLGFRVQQPHNVGLQWLAEDGLPGFLLGTGALLALLAVALARVRETAGPERGAQAALLAVAVAWVAQAPFEWTWDIPAATLPMLLALGVLAGRPARPRRVAARGTALAGVAVAFALMATSLALPELARQLSDGAIATSSREGATAADLERAARRADLAVRLDPVATFSLRTAADVAERRGRREDARRYLLRAVRRQPYDSTSWGDLVRLELTAGDRAGLLRAVTRAVELDPVNGARLSQARTVYSERITPGESASAAGTPLTSVPTD